MKTTFLTTLLLAVTSLTASAATISLVPFNATPFVGETFTVNLLVSANTQELLGFGLNYGVNNAGLTVSSYAINPFFGADLGLGDPSVAAFVFPGNTDTSVTLVSFSLIANAVGSSTFSVFSDLGDPNQGLFILDQVLAADLDSQVDINVLPAATIPEPGTFGLVSLTAVGAFFAARRRSRSAKP